MVRKYQVIEERLFADKVAVDSDSDCAMPAYPYPYPLIKYQWRCDGHSFVRTLQRLDSKSQKLLVSCPSSKILRLNTVDRDFLPENDPRRSKDSTRKKEEFSVISSNSGTLEYEFKTPYVDFTCDGAHNYRIQFVPDDSVVGKARQIRYAYEVTRAATLQMPPPLPVFNVAAATVASPKHKPLSVLLIMFDSLSRANAMRETGLPKFRKLLKSLYYSYPEGVDRFNSGGAKKYTHHHQAFVFNRLNSAGSHTGSNVVPLYTGNKLLREWEDERLRVNRIKFPVDEWIWDYAKKRGYITMYAGDTAVNIAGSESTCDTCHYRSPTIPHHEHKWTAKENRKLGSNVNSGFCDGDKFAFEQLFEYTTQYFTHHMKGGAAGASAEEEDNLLFTVIQSNVAHVQMFESCNQIDGAYTAWLQWFLEKHPDTLVVMFGDHGRWYEKGWEDGSFYEAITPFLSILAPTSFLEENPDVEEKLFINQQRWMHHYDLHLSLRSLLNYPQTDWRSQGRDFKSNVGAMPVYNLFAEEIPVDRSCDGDILGHETCICTSWKDVDTTDDHVQVLTQVLLDDINKRFQELSPPSSCQVLTLKKIDFAYHSVHRKFNNPNSNHYRITFSTHQGPAQFQGHIRLEDSMIASLEQKTMYNKYMDCKDTRVPIGFCVCKDFPEGTP